MMARRQLLLMRGLGVKPGVSLKIKTVRISTMLTSSASLYLVREGCRLVPYINTSNLNKIHKLIVTKRSILSRESLIQKRTAVLPSRLYRNTDIHSGEYRISCDKKSF